MTRHSVLAWLPVGLILLLAALTFWLTKAVDVREPGRGNAARHDPDIILDNFIARQLGIDGQERYTLRAKKMFHFQDDDSTELADVAFAAIENRVPPMHVSSTTARLTSKADEIFFTDKVVVTRQADSRLRSMTLETDYLHVIPDAGIGKTDRGVVLREGNNIIVAQGMELNSKTATATLNKAKATYYAKHAR
jgi:lipopolysaccharide export system protein LptC